MNKVKYAHLLLVNGGLVITHVGSHLAFGLAFHNELAGYVYLRVKPAELIIECCKQGLVHSGSFRGWLIGNEGVTEVSPSASSSGVPKLTVFPQALYGQTVQLA